MGRTTKSFFFLSLGQSLSKLFIFEILHFAFLPLYNETSLRYLKNSLPLYLSQAPILRKKEIITRNIKNISMGIEGNWVTLNKNKWLY